MDIGLVEVFPLPMIPVVVPSALNTSKSYAPVYPVTSISRVPASPKHMAGDVAVATTSMVSYGAMVCTVST